MQLLMESVAPTDNLDPAVIPHNCRNLVVEMWHRHQHRRNRTICRKQRMRIAHHRQQSPNLRTPAPGQQQQPFFCAVISVISATRHQIGIERLRMPDKPRIQPMNWSLTTLLLAACGGGGGGANAPTIAGFEKIEFNRQDDGTFLGKAPENTINIDDLLGPNISGLWSGYGVTVQSVTVVSDTTANIVVSGPEGSATMTFSITGVDANRFKLVQNGSKDAVVQFKVPPDYERPLDQNGDNVFEGVLQATVPGVATERASFKVVVTNIADGSANIPSPAGRSSVPAHTREGDEIEITIVEGNTEVFLMNTNRLSSFSQSLIAGPDADKFEIEIVNVQGQTKTSIKFKDAPSTDAPSTDAPSDVGGDNIYNFELDGSAEAIYGNLSFEITVIDNPNEIL